MDIINEQLCSQCHSYKLAQEMKQAIFLVENKLSDVEEALNRLKLLGINVDDQQKIFYRNHAGFRALSHSVDIDEVRTKSGQYISKLEMMEIDIRESFRQLKFRKNFFAYLFLLSICLGIAVFLLAKSYEQK